MVGWRAEQSGVEHDPHHRRRQPVDPGQARRVLHRRGRADPRRAGVITYQLLRHSLLEEIEPDVATQATRSRPARPAHRTIWTPSPRRDVFIQVQTVDGTVTARSGNLARADAGATHRGGKVSTTSSARNGSTSFRPRTSLTRSTPSRWRWSTTRRFSSVRYSTTLPPTLRPGGAGGRDRRSQSRLLHLSGSTRASPKCPAWPTSGRGEEPEQIRSRGGFARLTQQWLGLDEIEDAVTFAIRADDLYSDGNQVRPREAPAGSRRVGRPGLGAPTISTCQETYTLPPS
jgi:hypothetical protein